eukprot:jgi/Mesvir1/26766/Mv20542-RA.1
MPMKHKPTPDYLVERSWKERFETMAASVKEASGVKLPICCFCHGPSKTKKYVRLVPLSGRLVHECNVLLCPECATNMKQFHLAKSDGANTHMRCPLCMCDVVTHSEKFYAVDHALNELIAAMDYALCEHGCGAYLHADETKLHSATCNRNHYECGFSVDLKNDEGMRVRTGCAFVGKKEEITEHMKTCFYYHEASSIKKLKDKVEQVASVKSDMEKNKPRVRELLRRLFDFNADEMDAVMERLAQKEMERVGQLPLAQALTDAQPPITDSELAAAVDLTQSD